MINCNYDSECRAPEWFDSDCLGRLKTNVSVENWRLRVSNWRKVLDRLEERLENELQFTLTTCRPDVQSLGRDGDHQQLAIALQLLLVLAVNSAQKQMYIETITRLELNVQQDLMEAIQQLTFIQNERRSSSDSIQVTTTTGTSGGIGCSVQKPTHAIITGTSVGQSNHFSSVALTTTGSTAIDTTDSYQKDVREQLLRTMDNLRVANERHEQLLRQNHELGRRLMAEQNEKAALQTEHERLAERLHALLGSNDSSGHEKQHDSDDVAGSESARHVERLQQRLQQMEQELAAGEQARDELQTKLEISERELLQLRMANEHLSRKVQDTQQLQDELDVHRHSADQLLEYEQKLETYRRKLEELADMRKEWKALETQNRQLIAANVDLEQQLARSQVLRQQTVEYKRQVQQLQQQLLESGHKCDRLEFELEKQKERLEVQQQESNQLQQERAQLKAKLQILTVGQQISNRKSSDIDCDMSLGDSITSNPRLILGGSGGHCLELEINEQSGGLRDKLLRLEHENRLLKARLEQTNQEAVLLLRNSYQDAKSRCEQLEDENRRLNKKCFELDNQLQEEQRRPGSASTSGCSTGNGSSPECDGDATRSKHLEQKLRAKNANVQTLNAHISELEQRLARLQGELSRKQDAFSEMDCKYRKYVHKAKQAVHVLEPLSSALAAVTVNGGQQQVGSHCQIQPVGGLACVNNGPASAPAQPSANRVAQLNGKDALACGSVDALRQALIEKERKINELVVEMERVRHLSEMESRLLTVAIHNIAFNLQHKAASKRVLHHHHQQQQTRSSFGCLDNSTEVAANGSTGSSNTIGTSNQTANRSPMAGHVSLLSKQRQATARRNHLNV